MTPAPADHSWWLASRAAGITALLCLTVAVGVGLMMSGRVARRPGWPRVMLAVHEHAALAGLIAIAAHGILLLGDGFLRPTLADIAVPFAMERERTWTAMGVVGGWLAVALGLTWYARKRIGVDRWRKVHRLTIVVYALSVAHVLGAGTDGQEPWMQAFLLATGAPILFVFVMRVLLRRPAPQTAAA
ncbi:ferric reductase-like transmembrane domain-containing protein [Conexibacter sp. SYSU D00693]|uniref:ferric reductase-like transmembrane domain-containing protein n=1 Tax=Conexibacter sp. SYSU D00693 TaxID=2812560 RepID=UPI00196ACF7C|nr:ferric reductase-like transmembrane domain-containing protein [Conexibacter sp. SYSU D00693]